MLDHIIRISTFTGFALFGLRGLLPQDAFATVVVCLLLGTAGEYASVLCGSPQGCRIGELAKRRGWVTDETIRAVLSYQRDRGGRFGEIAVRQKFLSPAQLAELMRSSPV